MSINILAALCKVSSFAFPSISIKLLQLLLTTELSTGIYQEIDRP